MDEKEKKLMEQQGYIGIADISDFGFPFRYACLNDKKGIELIGRNLIPVYVFDEDKVRKMLELFLKAFNGESKKVGKIKKMEHKKVQTIGEEQEEVPLNLQIDALTG